MFRRNYHRIASFIALAAVIFAALAPTLAHAFPVENSNQQLWQEICSSTGAKQTPVVFSEIALSQQQPDANSSQNKPQDKMGTHFEHCPYCFSHAGSVALAPSAMAVFLAALNSPQLIEVYASPVLISYTTTTHPSHAPPSL